MNFKAMRYESIVLNRIVANKSLQHELYSNIITFTVEGHSERVLG